MSGFLFSSIPRGRKETVCKCSVAKLEVLGRNAVSILNSQKEQFSKKDFSNKCCSKPQNQILRSDKNCCSFCFTSEMQLVLDTNTCWRRNNHLNPKALAPSSGEAHHADPRGPCRPPQVRPQQGCPARSRHTTPGCAACTAQQCREGRNALPAACPLDDSLFPRLSQPWHCQTSPSCVLPRCCFY